MTSYYVAFGCKLDQKFCLCMFLISFADVGSLACVKHVFRHQNMANYTYIAQFNWNVKFLIAYVLKIFLIRCLWID